MRYILIILFLFNTAFAQSFLGVVANSGGPTDTSAQKFYGIGITDTRQKLAINYLCRALKSANLWDKMSVIYPAVGGTSTTHAYNLKDTGTYKLTFVNSPTHDANGINFNGTNQRALTGFSPSNLDNSHLSYYTRTNNTTGIQIPIGAIYASGGDIRYFQINITSANAAIGEQIASFTNTSTQGYYIGTRTSSTSLLVYKNGTQVASNTSTNTKQFLLGVNVVLGARIDQLGVFDFYSSHQCAFASIGTGLTASESETLSRIVQQYQTILGRQN